MVDTKNHLTTTQHQPKQPQMTCGWRPFAHKCSTGWGVAFVREDRNLVETEYHTRFFVYNDLT